MIVKKFTAATTRDALRLVRDALGPDALILSNRQTSEGVEIMAVADSDIASLTAPSISSATTLAAEAPAVASAANGSAHARPDAKPEAIPAETPSNAEIPTLNTAVVADLPGPATADILREMKSLRSLLEGQLAGLAWNDLKRRDPIKLDVTRRMLSAGFSPTVTKQLVDKAPETNDAAKTLKWVRAALGHNLKAAAAADEIVERGGVYALVGPTGVGKTTTVAKLAARCTLRHGAHKLALVTTDSYRIGAHEQLKIYGKILNVPVFSIKDETELQLTLNDLQHKHLVLIDTVGMGQRDRRLAEQIALLCSGQQTVKRILLLGATSHGSTLEDVVRAYRGEGMEGCIVTKVDEALNLGAVLDVMIRHRLPLHYVTNGQRVPEDLHLANSSYLIDRAFKPIADAFTPQDGDYPLLMGGLNASADSAEDGVRDNAL